MIPRDLEKFGGDRQSPGFVHFSVVSDFWTLPNLEVTASTVQTIKIKQECFFYLNNLDGRGGHLGFWQSQKIDMQCSKINR